MYGNAAIIKYTEATEPDRAVIDTFHREKNPFWKPNQELIIFPLRKST